MLAMRMGITDATSIVVFDLRQGGRCRGMLVGPTQGDNGGMHGFAAGSGDGDHGGTVGDIGMRGHAGDERAGTLRTQAEGSGAVQETEGPS